VADQKPSAKRRYWIVRHGDGPRVVHETIDSALVDVKMFALDGEFCELQSIDMTPEQFEAKEEFRGY